jgi:hypothetical protein
MVSRFKYPENVYEYLQRRRIHLNYLKLLHRRVRVEAAMFRRRRWMEEAGRLEEEAGKYLRLAREIEEEIAELESGGFVGEER